MLFKNNQILSSFKQFEKVQSKENLNTLNLFQQNVPLNQDASSKTIGVLDLENDTFPQ